YQNRVSRVVATFENSVAEVDQPHTGRKLSERWMVAGRGCYVKDHEFAYRRRRI
ncbi:hypothetical protein WH47_11557, partial [Habropoda laboriosa]